MVVAIDLKRRAAKFRIGRVVSEVQGTAAIEAGGAADTRNNDTLRPTVAASRDRDDSSVDGIGTRGQLNLVAQLGSVGNRFGIRCEQSAPALNDVGIEVGYTDAVHGCQRV